MRAPHTQRPSSPRVRLTWRDRRRIVYAIAIVGAAIFPRLAYRARWPTRFGLCSRIAYTAFNALFVFAIRRYVLPRLKQIDEGREQATTCGNGWAGRYLRQRLGALDSACESALYHSPAALTFAS